MDLLVLALVSVALFYILHHVLSRKKSAGNFPRGPRELPIIGNLHQLGLKPHLGICTLGEKFGKIFSLRFGSIRVVVLNDMRLMRDLLKLDGTEGRPNYLPAFLPFAEGIAYGTGDLWKEQRPFIVNALKEFGLGKQSMEGIVQSEVMELIEYLKNLNGEAINPKAILQTSTLNNTASMVNGERYSLLDPTILKIQELINKSIIDLPVPLPLLVFPAVVKWFPGLSGFNTMMKYSEQLMSKCNDIINGALKTYVPGVKRHVIDALQAKIIQTTDPKSSFYKTNGAKTFTVNIVNLFATGSETLATTLRWTILYLKAFPEPTEKLRAEISEILGCRDLPSSEDRLKMHYTNAYMAEVTRMGSIVPNSIFHDARKDVEFQGYTFPKGTIFLPNLYGVHHDPKIWGDPEKFRPERFLNADGKFVKHEALLPFGTGKRVCPAESFAMTEFFFYLCGLVKNFEFEFDKEKHPVFPSLEGKSNVVLEPQEYFVRFIPSEK